MAIAVNSFAFLSAWPTEQYDQAHGLPHYPSSEPVGCLTLVFVHVRPSTETLAASILDNASGAWPKIFEGTGGTGTFAADAGTSRVAVYAKVCVGNESEVIVPIPGSAVANSVGLIGSLCLTKSAGEVWETVTGTTGADTTSGTAYSATGGTNLSLTTNDLLLIACGIAGDTRTFNTFNVTATGATIGTITSHLDDFTAVGFDSRFAISSAPITAGTSSAAPVHTSTLSGATAGVTAFARIRVSTAVVSGFIGWGTPM